MVEIDLYDLLNDKSKDGLAKLELLYYQLDLVLDIVEERHWAKGFLDRDSIYEEMQERIKKEKRQPCLKVIKNVAVDRKCVPGSYPDWYKGKRRGDP